MSMKNDVSFLITDIMNFYEQQSTFNPNMPIRMLIYAGMVYSKYIETRSDFNMYSKRIQHLPVPKCICFYNGTDITADRTDLLLSDSFTDHQKGDMEVRVQMININYGHNKELMEACKPLKEYSWFVNTIRSNIEIFGNLEKSVDKALEMMPDSFVIKEFLIENRAEVKRMCITEYDEAKAKEADRQDYERELKKAKEETEKAIEDAIKAKEETEKAKKDADNDFIISITSLMKKTGLNLEDAMETLNISMDKREKFRKIIKL